jgi:exopolysaccharide production protein ExoZ
MIYNLHLLRVVAALAVVYYHTSSNAGLDLPLSFGKCGVDVFFVVSGFIIAHMGSKSPRSFLLRRLIRIVPFYWSATLCVFCVAWFFPHLLRQTRPDLPHLFCSLLFIPHETSYSGMFPTLLLGWTLNYEMYFYVLFAIALALSPRFAPLICSALLTINFVAIVSSGTENETLRFYARPIVFEFVFGIAAFYCVELIDRRAEDLRNVRWFKWLLYIATFAALPAVAVQEIHAGFGMPSYLSAGLPAFILVLGAILIETVYRNQAKNNLIFFLGESSYILYLIHPYIIYGVLRLILGPTSHLGNMSIVALLVVLLALPAAIAVIIHLCFEKPIMSFLRRSLIRNRAPASRSGAIPLTLETSHSR